MTAVAEELGIKPSRYVAVYIDSRLLVPYEVAGANSRVAIVELLVEQTVRRVDKVSNPEHVRFALL